ncbi:MAG: hypothetical protein IPO04_10990 [Cytophagaceae bacterium]|nr:hypothetical protein [Cytophagaceae bacterium]
MLLGIAMATYGQVKKPVAAKKPVTSNQKKVATPAAKTPMAKQAPSKPQPKISHSVTSADQKQYDDYHKAQEENYKEQAEREANKAKYSSVAKFNFMGLIFGGTNFEFEKKIAKKNSLVGTVGYYPFGLFKGGGRLGFDAKQYIGNSNLPKGMFVSLGSLYNFRVEEKSTSGLLYFRGLFGYQAVSNHVTFEVAGGPAYSILIADSSDPDAKFKVGFLPTLKFSIGYAF